MSPSGKGLSGWGGRDSGRVSKPFWNRDVDPNHSAAASPRSPALRNRLDRRRMGSHRALLPARIRVGDLTESASTCLHRIANETLSATKTLPGGAAERGQVQGEWEPAYAQRWLAVAVSL